MLIQNGDTRIELLDTGDIQSISVEDITMNQLFCNHVDEMASNLFLRISNARGGFDIYKLLGKASNGEFSVSCEKNQVQFRGSADTVSYHVFLTPVQGGWFYDVILVNSGNGPVGIDMTYGQDLGLASKGHIQANEAYNSQYIDHKSFVTEQGPVLLSRQNQWKRRGKTGNPVCMLGSFHKSLSFSTDGYLFFGMDYKWDNTIKELTEPYLDNRIYQYEFAYLSLQSEKHVLLPGGMRHFTFYASVAADFQGAVEEPFDIEPIKTMHKQIDLNVNTAWKRYVPAVSISNSLSGIPLKYDLINNLYPCRRHEEFHEGRLISFFTDNGAHVVLAEKERLVERSHGHIILSGNNDAISEDVLASTNYMFGVFSSQTVIGNTSFNKMNSICRNGLNVQKTSGQRVMVRRNGQYRLLTMPSLYESGMNYSRWLYALEDDILEFRVYTRLGSPALNFEFISRKGLAYDLAVCNRLCSAPDEYDAPLDISLKEGALILKHRPGTVSKDIYPDLTFTITSDTPFELKDQSFFLGELAVTPEPMAIWSYTQIKSFSQTVIGSINGGDLSAKPTDFESETSAYRRWMVSRINGFQLFHPSEIHKSELDKINDIVLWFSHDARIHYASPHGLEQFGGAAWGTRDVCQGPFEFFMAAQKTDTARNILITLYTHQYIDDGNWPQWFMFDRYFRIQGTESHGDIIVWPLKALASYLNVTGDQDILGIPLRYAKKEDRSFTDYEEPLFDHVQRQIQYIGRHFITNTALSRYGDGDWDDTLQPHDPALRSVMVSAWTVSLTYQAFVEFADAISESHPDEAREIRALAMDIRNDFHNYVICDGVTAGFILFREENVKYLLHPRDGETGLTYRLLPMTRSMISGMFTPNEADDHYRLIRRHLYHPDGVRLMDTTCRYRGGVSTYFTRAETAANFGREIGLQYVHAHIRFVEAMAKTGRNDEAWDGLLKVTPITIRDVVSNAACRQSNCYFSSSDGQFDNRYDAMARFDTLRTGESGVKSGWRIYSSGPGIFINQLISNVLGLRLQKDRVILDPVLPERLDGMIFKYRIHGKPVSIIYHLTGEDKISALAVDGKSIPFETLPNPYRAGGASFREETLGENSVIEIYR